MQIAELVERLSEAAKAATPGPWESDGEVIPWLSGVAPGVAVRYYSGNSGRPVCMCQPHLSGKYHGAGSMRPVEDAAHIALANPANILALLTELRVRERMILLMSEQAGERNKWGRLEQDAYIAGARLLVTKFPVEVARAEIAKEQDDTSAPR